MFLSFLVWTDPGSDEVIRRIRYEGSRYEASICGVRGGRVLYGTGRKI